MPRSLLLALLGLGLGILAASPSAVARAIPEGDGWAYVYNVVDGDTIDVTDEFGDSFRVRLIGLDTPETVQANTPVQCFGPEATQRTREYVEGRWVWLERDVSQTDRFGRALRYVWTEDNLMLNAQLVYEGYASVSTFPPDVRNADWFLDLQRQARENGSGLWGACPVAAVPAPAPAAPQAATCDPSYPDICISPPPPHLDCADIGARRFRVRPPDPHRLDGDRDGIGCE